MPYNIYTNISFGVWLIILLVWSVGFFGNKKTRRIPNSFEQVVVSILLLLGAALTFVVPSGFVPEIIVHQTTFSGAIGVIITLLGAAFAIWARLTIGKNWSGAVMTVKEDHELVESGPYALVRHPIYTGLFTAALGTAITLGYYNNFVGVAILLAAFIIRIRREEALMTAQFPEKYPEYKTRTKVFVPFVF